MQRLTSLVFASLVISAPACGGDGDGDGTASSTDDGGSESSTDSGADSGDGDSGDGDSGDGDSGDGDGACSDECPTPAAAPPAGEDLAIEWVDLATDTASIVNTGAAEIDTTGWQVCVGPGRYAAFSAAALPAGASTTIDVSALNLTSSDALGVYDSPNFTDSAAMHAFVQWGTSGSPRESVAVGAGLWTAGTFVDVCSTHDLLVATGDAANASAWESANASCAP